MSRAYECDRCQNLFRGTSLSSFQILASGGSDGQTINMTTPGGIVELCGRCIEDLKDAWRG